MASYEHPVKQSKIDLIDEAFKLYDIKSILDLGGCWGVNGGYTFHALKNYNLDEAHIVDGHITDLTAERAKEFPQLRLHQAELGDQSTAATIGKVDAIIMYDIILHQVAPNWDEFIKMWAARAKFLIIYNQDWTRSDQVVRFIDNDVEWYLKNVPHGNAQAVRNWYPEHGQKHPKLDRKWGDVHYFWQFGIPHDRLADCLKAQGFKIDVDRNDGPWNRSFPWVNNDAFLASRAT